MSFAKVSNENVDFENKISKVVDTDHQILENDKKINSDCNVFDFDDSSEDDFEVITSIENNSCPNNGKYNNTINTEIQWNPSNHFTRLDNRFHKYTLVNIEPQIYNNPYKLVNKPYRPEIIKTQLVPLQSSIDLGKLENFQFNKPITNCPGNVTKEKNKENTLVGLENKIFHIDNCHKEVDKKNQDMCSFKDKHCDKEEYNDNGKLKSHVCKVSKGKKFEKHHKKDKYRKSYKNCERNHLRKTDNERSRTRKNKRKRSVEDKDIASTCKRFKVDKDNEYNEIYRKERTKKHKEIRDNKNYYERKRYRNRDFNQKNDRREITNIYYKRERSRENYDKYEHKIYKERCHENSYGRERSYDSYDYYRKEKYYETADKRSHRKRNNYRMDISNKDRRNTKYKERNRNYDMRRQ